MNETKPDGLLAQYKLLGAVIDAEWATRLDHKVARHVIDRYYSKHSNSRASLRFLEKATGATRNSVITSTRRLTANGVFRARLGVGTRPTEYVINFDFGKPLSGRPDCTTTSGAPDHTPCGASDCASSASSGAPSCTESYLLDRLTSRSTESRINDALTGSPLAGLTPDPAAPALDPQQAGQKAGGPFDQLWGAYPRKHGRSKAKAAYRDLAPNAELHGRLVQAATELADHYRASNTDRKWWKHLHTWLAGECWLEDLPVPYENAKEVAIARTKERAPRKAKDDQSESDEARVGISPGTPMGRHVVEIVGSDEETKTNGDIALSFRHRVQGGKHDGKEFTHRFAYFDSKGIDDKGSSTFFDIRQSTGKPNSHATSELHGAVLCAVVSRGGVIQYEPTGHPCG